MHSQDHHHGRTNPLLRAFQSMTQRPACRAQNCSGIMILLPLLFFAAISHAGRPDIIEVTNANNSGPGSLRDAVAQANASEEDVDIRIPESVGTINITTGPLEITGDNVVWIIGYGDVYRTLNANTNSRILVVTNPDSRLGLSGMHLTGGQTTANGVQPATCAPGSGHGGAICALGDLELENVIFEGNQTLGDHAYGGAIFAAGDLEFSVNAVIRDNSTHGALAHGGAVYAIGETRFRDSPTREEVYLVENNHAYGTAALGGAVFATDFDGDLGHFSQNSASYGGALAAANCNPSSSTDIRVTAMRFDGNTASQAGGAIYQAADCQMLISSSVFTGNSCQSAGGGALASEGKTFIRQSIFDGNSCTAPGGAIMGVDLDLSVGLSATGSNILINNATTGPSNHGGAIAADDLILKKSTVVNNSTNGLEAHGGGIWVTGEMDIGNATISKNSALGSVSSGGGLYYSGDHTGLKIHNVTLIDNQASDGGHGVFINPEMPTQALEIDMISTVLAANGPGADNFVLKDTGLGHVANIIQSVFGDSSTEITGSDVANIFTNAVAFDSLDDNGCYREAGLPGEGECPQSYMPDTGSVVLDAGDNPNGETSDQRGLTYPRTFGGATDIGAIEVSPEPSISTSIQSIDFGTIVFDPQVTEVTDSFTIESGGPGILHILNVRSDNLLDTEDDCELQLSAGDSCDVTVSVDLDYFGNFQPNVEIFSDTPGSPLLIPVSFNLITGAELQASPAMIKFEDTPVNIPSSIETVVITNIGSEPLEISELSIFNQQPEFAIVNDDCGQPLPTQATCSVDLQFTPSAAGILNDRLGIRSNSLEPFAFDEILLEGSSGIIFINGFEG